MGFDAIQKLFFHGGFCHSWQSVSYGLLPSGCAMTKRLAGECQALGAIAQ
jgi:hypothetical protein